MKNYEAIIDWKDGRQFSFIACPIHGDNWRAYNFEDEDEVYPDLTSALLITEYVLDDNGRYEE